SLDAMRKMSQDMSGGMESMNIKPDAIDVMVLGPDAALVTSPFHMSVKPRGKPVYQTQGVWTGVVARRGGRWQTVSTHESVLHPDQMMAALTPAPAKKSAPSKGTPKRGPAKKK